MSEAGTVETSEAQARVFAYQVLGRLLLAAPDTDLLRGLATLEQPADASSRFSARWAALANAAGQASASALEHEYNDLFIGLGRGQLVPYGSWYATGFLMDRPLARLRTDLQSLGFERDPDKREPEDHMGALCEVMAMLVETEAQASDSAATQAAIASERQFFQAHLEPWGTAFFRDLAVAPAATFYVSVAELGETLVDFEADYLKLLN